MTARVLRTVTQTAHFLNCAKVRGETRFQELTADSRAVKPGDLFYAHRGLHVNGCDFIHKAQEHGAIGVLLDSGAHLTPEQAQGLTIPVMHLPSGMSIGRFAAWFYDYPCRKLKLIGVTGTNGKSTITQLIAQLLTALGRKCAVFGTLGYGFLPNLQRSSNTTLDAVSLQRELSHCCEQGAVYAALEVSSIGVVQGRISGCEFTAGAFTNLTRDHLDFHKTMERYLEAKKAFLDQVPSSRLAINVSDKTGRSLLPNYQDCIMYGEEDNFITAQEHFRRLWCRQIQYEHSALRLSLDGSCGRHEVRIPLMGEFNAYNFMAAASVMMALNFDFDAVCSAAAGLNPVRGRMECFSAPGKPRLIVDYAHTPDGVECALKAARAHTPGGKVWVVLGCGGDRDHGKRPMMAIKASVYADHAIFTSDNPRSEDPEAILEDMMRGVTQADNVQCIPDRTAAIKEAFAKAGAHDCVLIAGKGHEDYQIFAHETVHYSDRELAAKLTGVKLD